MAVNVSKIVKFGFALKNLPKIMYHMYILNNDQLPDLVHDHVDLDVHLDPQDGLERLWNHKILIPHEKLGYLHVYRPGITRIEEVISCLDHWVPDDEVLLPPGDDV